MHIQLLRPGTLGSSNRHRMIGRVSFASLTLGTIAALWLAAEHGPVGEYGGYMSMFGFWFMSLRVYGCAVMSVLKIRSGNVAEHRKWSIRFAGSMWGAFWIFRVMLFVLGPLLRNYEAAALLTCIWFSAPLGVLIAELFRRTVDPTTQRSRGPGHSAGVGSRLIRLHPPPSCRGGRAARACGRSQ